MIREDVGKNSTVLIPKNQPFDYKTSEEAVMQGQASQDAEDDTSTVSSFSRPSTYYTYCPLD